MQSHITPRQRHTAVVIVDKCACELHVADRDKKDRLKAHRSLESLLTQKYIADGYDSKDMPALPAAPKLPATLTDYLKGYSPELVELTCCERVTQPSLSTRAYPDGVKMVPWACTHLGSDGEFCKSCGVNKFPIADCGTFMSIATPVKLLEWAMADRTGFTTNKDGIKVQRKQLELCEVRVPLNELVPKFEKQLRKARIHHAEAKWLATCRKIEEETLRNDAIWIGTDFSASMDLKAACTDNCSEDAHAVLDIFVVLHNQRKVTVTVNGVAASNTIYDCDVWYFFGDCSAVVFFSKTHNH